MVIESDIKKTKSAYFFILLLGLVFLLITKNMTDPNQNQTAARLLGMILLILGAGGLAFSDAVKIDFDSDSKKFLVHKKSYFNDKKISYSFSDIEKILIKSVSRKNQIYTLTLKLKNNKNIHTGKWSSNPDELIALAQSISAITETPVDQSSVLFPLTTTENVWALVGSFIVYALWYKKHVGNWCPAMWFGTAPIIIIFSSYLIIRKLIQYLK